MAKSFAISRNAVAALMTPGLGSALSDRRALDVVDIIVCVWAVVAALLVMSGQIRQEAKTDV